MVVGAGSAGEKILRETLNTKYLHKTIVCFIDDDPHKIGRRIHGVPIVGDRNTILDRVSNIKLMKYILLYLQLIKKK